MEVAAQGENPPQTTPQYLKLGHVGERRQNKNLLLSPGFTSLAPLCSYVSPPPPPPFLFYCHLPSLSAVFPVFNIGTKGFERRGGREEGEEGGWGGVCLLLFDCHDPTLVKSRLVTRPRGETTRGGGWGGGCSRGGG